MESLWSKWVVTRITDTNPEPCPYLGSDVAEERTLAKWVAKVKGQYRRKTLPEQDIERISSLPGWSWGKKQDAKFNSRAEKWSTWVRVHGKTPKDNNQATVEERPLARWANRYQVLYKKDKLPEYQFIALNQLHGWVWRTTPIGDHGKGRGNMLFKTRVEQWKAFVEKHGRAPTKKESKEVYMWKNRIFNLLRKEKLPDAKVQLLSTLPGWDWSEATSELENYFRMARKWSSWVKFNEKTYPRAQSHNPVEAKLGEWAEWFLQMLKEKQVPEDFLERIHKLPHWTDYLTIMTLPCLKPGVS